MLEADVVEVVLGGSRVARIVKLLANERIYIDYHHYRRLRLCKYYGCRTRIRRPTISYDKYRRHASQFQNATNPSINRHHWGCSSLLLLHDLMSVPVPVLDGIDPSFQQILSVQLYLPAS